MTGDTLSIQDTSQSPTSQTPLKPKKQPSTPDSSFVNSVLGGLKGMSLESAVEIDDFRARLEHDWGDVHSILMASEGSFADAGSGYLVAQGEIKKSGFPWAAIMIVDLRQDAVFAAQYDGENKVFNQFEEEKEGLTQPAPLTDWMKKYR